MTEKFIMFRNRLEKVLRHRGRQARKQGISCYRLYDHDLPEFPFCIEFYGDHLYIAEYKRQHGMDEAAYLAWQEGSLQVIRDVLGVDPEEIFLKLRQRKPGRMGQYQKLETEKRELEVAENGLRFLVNLSDYLDTGLFLDHRLTRQQVREQSSGKMVLNLFAYTGSFSVYAAAGGASEVVTVDLSNTYIEWARRNMELNGFHDESRYQFVQADVLQFLKMLSPASFDLIVLDPPSFSNSKRMEEILDVQRDHVRLINQCLAGLTPGGQLYFSTNLRDFRLDTAALAPCTVKDITRATTPFDFEGSFSRWCYRLTLS